MAYTYLDLLTTEGVKDAQSENDARDQWAGFEGKREFTSFDENAAAFIAKRDSFYMASMSESGWPYIQHRGGPEGFLKVLDDTTLGFADYSGNRQYITLGNVRSNDRVALFLMDYPRRKRMKMLANLQAFPADTSELMERLVDPAYRANVERLYTLRLAAYDWNCPQHIVQRFTKVQMQEALAPIEQELEQLRAENSALKERLGV